MIDWYYLVIISAILTGLAQIIEKRLLKVEHALAFSLIVTVSVAVVSLVFIPFANFSISSSQWLLIFTFSATLALSYWLSARMFRHGNISIASPILNVLPILFVVIGAFFLLNETLTTVNYLAIIIIMIAAYLALAEARRNGKSDKTVRLYQRLVFAAVIVSAANTLLLKYVIVSIDPYAFLITTSILTSVFLSFEVLGKTIAYRATAISEIRKNARSLVAMVLLTVGYRIIFYFAILVAPISIATPMSSAIIVIVTVISGGLMFHEKRMKARLMLSAVMLIGVYLLVS